jgi:tricorn protease-like protein
MDNRLLLYFALPALLLASPAALADGGKVTILPPADGTVVSTKDKVTVSYEAVWGPKGNHLHFYLDGHRVGILRQDKGTAEVSIPMAGKHELCLEIETSWHFSTDVKQCVTVTAQ